MWKAKVYVSLKPGILDPQGSAVHHALDVMGYKEVRDVRIGKYIEVLLEAEDKAKAAAKVREMGERLLANPIIESFTFTLEEAAR